MTTTKKVAASSLAAAALLTAGYGYAHATTHTTAPAPCSIDGGTMASGDAGNIYVPQMHSVQTFVCTDGTLVHVTHYGSAS